MVFDPEKDNSLKFKIKAMRMLGALSVIDNTKPIALSTAKSGDLIMTKHNNVSGHTRVIHTVTHESSVNKYKIVWYQGNLPKVKPERKEEYFSNIDNVFGNKSRRWRF